MKKMKAGKRKARPATEDIRGSRNDELFGFLAGEVKLSKQNGKGNCRSLPAAGRPRLQRAPSPRRRGGAGDAGGSETRPYWRRFEGGARVGYFRAKALLLGLLYVAHEGATHKAFCAGG